MSPSKLRIFVVLLLICIPLVRLLTFDFLLEANYSQDVAARAVYALPFTQFDSFAAGAAISVFRLQKMRNATLWFFSVVLFAAVCGMTILAVDYIYYRDAFLGALGFPAFMLDYHEYVWGYSVINAIAAIGIICVLQKAPFTRILNLPGLPHLGKISYGVYVYHFPLLLISLYIGRSFSVGNTTEERVVVFVGWAAATILLSEISFRHLEAPLLRLKDAINFASADSREAGDAIPVLDQRGDPLALDRMTSTEIK